MFKMFKVGELFDIHPTTAYKMKNSELFASDGTTPVLSNSSVDNGIGGYCGLAPTERGGIITFSDTTTGADTMFYQSRPFIGYPHVQGMYPYQSDRWNEKCCLYVISCIRKSAGNGWSYAVKFNRTLVKELSIELPVIESSDPDHKYTVDDIDWQYMRDRITELERDRIAELEQERIAELDAYLVASGRDDYELTDEDKEILSLSPEFESDEAGASEADFGNGQVVFKAFKVGELFDIHPTNTYKMKNDELFASNGTTPVLSNSSVNNGIGGYCGLTPTERGGMITFSDTTTGADTMFYQSSPFIGYPHVQGMYPYQPDKWDEKCCLYVISCIRKSAGNGWSYAVKFNRMLVKELSIELPVIASLDLDHECKVDDINFDYMERYIRAIEKLAIADVAKYKDKLITTARRVVGV